MDNDNTTVTITKEQLRANLRNKIKENQMRRSGQIYRKQQTDLKETKERKAGTDKKLGKTLTKFLQKDGLRHVLKQFGVDDITTEKNIMEEIQRGDVKTYTDVTKIITKHMYKKHGKSVANAPLDINSEQFANMFRELKELDQQRPTSEQPEQSNSAPSSEQAHEQPNNEEDDNDKKDGDLLQQQHVERKTMQRSKIKD